MKLKRKTKKSLHYAVHVKDLKAWGAPTLCGKPKPRTSSRDKVTCKECLKHTDWSVDQTRKACERPLVLPK